MIDSIDAEKVVDKTQHPFNVKKKKKGKKPEIEGNFLSLIKSIYQKKQTT